MFREPRKGGTRSLRSSCFLLLFLLVGCTAEPADDTESAAERVPAKNILLVTLDTTRADRLGAYGYRRAVTPTIDRLAELGVVFESAVAPTPITLPSHASILTGVYPSAHGVRDNAKFALAPEATLISEVLKRHGWRTGAFVGSYVLDARFGLDQGFEVYRRGATSGVEQFATAERPADDVFHDAREWLSGLRPDEKFFAWVHFFDPHFPDEPPESWKRRLSDPYDGEIAFCDEQLGRLLDELKHRGLADNLLTVVTADHGEALGEHDEPSHGVFLYQATIRVPLVLSGPPVGNWSGKRIRRTVSITDIAATLLALAGLPSEEMPDVKVPPLLTPDGEPSPDTGERAIYLESYLPYYSFHWHAFRGLLWRGYKFIQGHRSELYALERDPRESLNLAGTELALVGEMEARLRHLLDEHAALNWVERAEIHAGERDLLESLGYVAGSVGGDPFDPTLPDPIDRIGDPRLIGEGLKLVREWKRLMHQPPAATAWENGEREAEGRRLLEQAREFFVQVKENNPRDNLFPPVLGMVEVELGNYEAAIPILERVVRDPFAAASDHGNLARAYLGVGRRDAAAAQIERAAAADPSRAADYYRWLAKHFEEDADLDRALSALEAMAEVVENGSPEQRWLSMERERIEAEQRAPRDPR